MPGETVLIVEDDDSLRVALADSLARLGYEIIEAGTGTEGYALAAQQLPDLILLDLGLPDVDGLSVAKKLREQPETAGIVVAALTAEEISGVRAEEVFKHCIGYIPKPVGLDRLARNVALFLRVGRPRRKPRKRRPRPMITPNGGIPGSTSRSGRSAGCAAVRGGPAREESQASSGI